MIHVVLQRKFDFRHFTLDIFGEIRILRKSKRFGKCDRKIAEGHTFVSIDLLFCSCSKARAIGKDPMAAEDAALEAAEAAAAATAEAVVALLMSLAVSDSVESSMW